MSRAEYMRDYRAAKAMQKSVDELGAGKPTSRGSSAKSEIDRLFRDNQELREEVAHLKRQLAERAEPRTTTTIVPTAWTSPGGFNTRPFTPAPKISPKKK